MPDEPLHSVLFVCTGNTCRSPMAAALLRRQLAGCGIEGVTVDSAGLAALPGAPASGHAVAVMAELGTDISAHCAKPLTAELARRFDCICVMSEHHAAALRSLDGGALSGRVRVRGVPDPWGGSLDDYRAARNALADILVRALPCPLFRPQGACRRFFQPPRRSFEQ